MSRKKSIQTVEYSKAIAHPAVVALGFFDCIHIGHIKLIEECKLIAFKKNCKSAVFTFLNSPFDILGKRSGQILNFEERLKKLDSLDVDYCIAAQFDRQFSNLSPKDFLDCLIEGNSIEGIVVGEDYTFGKNGAGNVEFLAKWCQNNDIDLTIVDYAFDGDIKISSSTVRELLIEGNLKKANVYLGQPYFIIGDVICGSKRGRGIGFATANVAYPHDKLKIKAGSYYTRTFIDGVWLKSVTNVGDHPTFEDYNFNIESYIIYYKGDIYGKKIVIEFLERIRDIYKFSNKEQLAERIRKDVKFAINSKL